MPPTAFSIEKKEKGGLARAGELRTPHGVIHTPAFTVVGTKGTVKSLSPEELIGIGTEVVLANTYHLYLEPGSESVKEHGGVGAFMNWRGPTITDSGGFQAFSLGAALGKGVSKIIGGSTSTREKDEEDIEHLRAKITEEGVEFKSYIDGSAHFFTPEKSIEIQHALGADIMFAFDECTSPLSPIEYQREALERTHRWAKRSLLYHQSQRDNAGRQALFGIVQGGRFRELREESARTIGNMSFDGFGVGGSFEKEDIQGVVGAVNKILPEDRPRHLLGIGEPKDLFLGIEAGIDLFDCVAPTRIARNGQLYTREGKINILNSKFRTDMAPGDMDCGCYTCSSYTRSYLSHLFHAKELFGLRLASIHNVYFIVNLVKNIRMSILNGNFNELKDTFFKKYNT